MKLRVRDVIAATGGTYFGDSAALERELSFVTMDSREAGPDCLFLAIPGNRVDGHDFIPQVAEKGGLCMLCQRPADFFKQPALCLGGKMMERFHRNGRVKRRLAKIGGKIIGAQQMQPFARMLAFELRQHGGV